MGISLATTIIQDLFLNTHIFGLAWIMLVATITLTLFLITREISAWKHLAFPVSVGWMSAGIRSYTIFDGIILTGTAVMFVIETLSISTAGRIIETVHERTTDAITRTRKATRDLLKETADKTRAKAIRENLKGTAIFRTQEQLRKDMIRAAGNIDLLRGQKKYAETRATEEMQVTGTKKLPTVFQSPERYKEELKQRARARYTSQLNQESAQEVLRKNAQKRANEKQREQQRKAWLNKTAEEIIKEAQEGIGFKHAKRYKPSVTEIRTYEEERPRKRKKMITYQN